jgi:pimeloyl-ACP methyl ester carboxylesterase
MSWHRQGGSGPRTVLLLHGLGATGAVWTGLEPLLEQRSLAWIAPDFSGHGLAAWQDNYSVGQLAADVAPLVQNTPELFIVGHSLGVYVGLALASSWFGTRAKGLLGIGPKIHWSEADLQGSRDLAGRPVRWYQQEGEALARYRRVSGLDEAVAPDAHSLARGITKTAEGFRLSQDPRTFMVAGAPFATLAASSTARLMLARGERDAMV